MKTVKSSWKAPEYGHTYTRRSEIKPMCRNGYKDVDPAWLRRNADQPTFRCEYWDGVTDSYPGKWVASYPADLRAAKKEARALVESGTARHCDVSLLVMAWSDNVNGYMLRKVWEYGSYERTEEAT